MNKRQFLTTLALSGLASPISAQDISDSGDTILKLLKKYKFKRCTARYLVVFAGEILESSITFLSGKIHNYEEVLMAIESNSGFEKWLAIELDNKIAITLGPNKVYTSI